jgi:CTD small phosphatase-like protein 2
VTSTDDRYFVNTRPFLTECLGSLEPLYELAIFTKYGKEYADIIIDKIDPFRRYFKHRLYYQHCVKRDEVFIKHLGIIIDREMEDIVIVDSSIISFGF